MTGYATASANAATGSETPSETGHSSRAEVSIELRSVNSRFLDLAFRLPDEFRGAEPALRELLTARLRRGKVELRLSTREGSADAWPHPQIDQLHALSLLEANVQAWLPKAGALTVQEVLQWCRNATVSPQLDGAILDAARRALDGLLDAREREGDKLVRVLQERVRHLRSLAAAAGPLLPEVVARQRQRFLDRWNEALQAGGETASVTRQAQEDRALAEATAFAVRIDVAEELARLTAHLDEIDRLLLAGGEIGKRLDFLIQELQREANTLGSKSAALELTQLSVEMKVAVEQLREQVQNIE